MITGKIMAPAFEMRNKKIVLRHIYAVALAFFFRENTDVYNNNDADVFLNGVGYERLCDYLRSQPAAVKEFLRRCVPNELYDVLGIDTFSWVDNLIGEDGVLAASV